MSDFAPAWELSRKRFVDEITGLSQAQLNWQLHPKALTIGQMALHVAGVEVMFASQLSGTALDEGLERLRRCATEGVVNEDDPFPFTNEEITPDLVIKSLELSRVLAEPLIRQASSEVRTKELKSALGPIITGEGAFARFGFHAGYHQGQAYLIKTAPGFPQ